MNQITPLAETADTVTLTRADFEALIDAAEDALDAAAVRAREAREAGQGVEAARADYLPGALARRILVEGESPVRVWREHRGLRQAALAEAAGVSGSYLAEIEAGKKPGSVAALAALARALRVPMEDLIAAD